MKKYFSILVAATAFAACSTDEFQCVLSGNVDRPCDTLFIRGDNVDTLYAAVPVKKGTYKWKTHVETPFLAQVRFGEDHAQAMRVIIEPGQITLNIPAVDEGDNGVAYSMPSGTPLNDSISSYSEAAKAFDDQISQFFDTFDKNNDENRGQIESIANNIYQMYLARVLTSMQKNTDNLYGIFLLRNFQQGEPADVLAKILPVMEQNFPDNVWVKTIKERVQDALKTCIGQPFIDFSMATPDGKTLSLSDVIANNKVTLIDFWASWCGPCCAEIPNVKAAWEKYHKQGFEVIGVSLDNDEAAWKDAIKKFGMKWPQMSDLKGWSSEGAKVYGITGIPFTLLVDQQGNIVGKDLRGENLIKKLDTVFGK